MWSGVRGQSQKQTPLPSNSRTPWFPSLPSIFKSQIFNWICFDKFSQEMLNSCKISQAFWKQPIFLKFLKFFALPAPQIAFETLSHHSFLKFFNNKKNSKSSSNWTFWSIEGDGLNLVPVGHYLPPLFIAILFLDSWMNLKEMWKFILQGPLKVVNLLLLLWENQKELQKSGKNQQLKSQSRVQHQVGGLDPQKESKKGFEWKNHPNAEGYQPVGLAPVV